MFTLSATALLVIAAAASGGGALAFLLTRAFYRARLREAAGRLERLGRARAQANALLMQARRHAETLQKELAQARRARPAAPPVPLAPAIPLPETVVDGDGADEPAAGFAPTLPFAA